MADTTPIDREWLRDRLISFGLKASDVHQHVEHCTWLLALSGLGTRGEVEAFLGCTEVLDELRDAYRTVLRRQPEPATSAPRSVALSMTTTVQRVPEVVDPVALCRWGAQLYLQKLADENDGSFRDAARALRVLLTHFPEAADGLARAHKVTPAGLAIGEPLVGLTAKERAKLPKLSAAASGARAVRGTSKVTPLRRAKARRR